MATPLTLNQTIAIATRNSILPLHASSLANRTVGKTTFKFPLSLKTVRDTVQSQQTVFAVQIRDSSLLSASTSFADLQKKWVSRNKAWVPTRQSLTKFFSALSASGITVKKLSPDWQTVVLSGSAQVFASVAGVTISTGGAINAREAHTFAPREGWVDIGGGAAGFAGVLMAAGALTGPPGWLFAIGAVTATVVSGGFIGAGIYDVANPPVSGTQYTPLPGYEQPDASVVYGAPSASAATTIATEAGSAPDMGDGNIPSAPSAPPICPVVCPIVPGGGSEPPPVCPSPPPVCAAPPPVCVAPPDDGGE